MQFFAKFIMAAFFAVFTLPAHAAVVVGQAAPNFTAVDSNGKIHNLSDFKGKTVVLEWTNDGCPFVQKHYETHNMQKLQKEYTDKGVIWLSIISSAKGEQGNVTGDEANKLTKERDAHPTAVLLDESGEVGKLYDAKTTPHMFVINPEGILVYKGAIDDNKSADHSTVEGAHNYVAAALDAVEKGEAVATPETQPYGCFVKYK